MKIILMRHGETLWNTERRLQGCQDIPLNDHGIAQIKNAGLHLASSKFQIDHIMSSPLQRAYKSAESIAQAVGYPLCQITTSPLFLERSFGECEGFTYEEAMEKYPDGNYPGMETLDELYNRAASAITYLETHFPNQTVLVASHGAFIKASLVVASHGKISYFDNDIWIENGSFCVLEKENDAWKISVGL